MTIGARNKVRGAAIAVAIVLSAAGVYAQDIAAAEALFREGRALMESGDLGAACAKLAESQRLDPSSGTLINLAKCHEKQGKHATAWAEFLAAARLARTQGKTDRVDEATRQASDLEKRLSYLTLQVARDVPELHLERDGVALERSSVGSRIPVDPGKHTIVASAPGHESASVEVTIGEVADSQVVQIPELTKTVPSTPDKADIGSGTGTGDEQPKKPERGPTTGKSTLVTSTTVTPPPRHSDNTVAWIVGGAGLVVTGVGATFGVMALSAYHDADSACPSHSACGPDVITASERAQTRATLANILVPVGLVGLVAGAFLLVSGSGNAAGDSHHAKTVVAPHVGAHEAGLSVRTAF